MIVTSQTSPGTPHAPPGVHSLVATQGVPLLAPPWQRLPPQMPAPQSLFELQGVAAALLQVSH